MQGFLTRRQLLQLGALATITARAPRPLSAQTPVDAQRSDPWVDCHLHCFAGLSDDRFPYHPQAPYRPEAAATPEHLIECMDGAGVAYAVVVHPEPYQDDHRYLEHCLAVGKGRLKGTLLLFSDRAGSLDRMPELAERLAVVAVRVHAYAPERLPPFGKPELRRLWELATQLKLAVQIHLEPRFASGFEPLIREFTDTTVIIDHLGRPFQGLPDEHAVVVNWSRYPHTVMKLSAIPAQETYPHRDIRPVIRELVEAFGPDRMIYGGGFGAGATAESYRGAFQRARSLLDFLTPEQQAKVLGGTALRLFGFGQA